jgi:hypothetical protein
MANERIVSQYWLFSDGPQQYLMYKSEILSRMPASIRIIFVPLGLKMFKAYPDLLPIPKNRFERRRPV